jgi:hypothetical protein
VDSYKDWVADLLHFTDIVKNSNRQGFQNIPVVLLAPSLAGNLILHAAIDQVRAVWVQSQPAGWPADMKVLIHSLICLPKGFQRYGR